MQRFCQAFASAGVGESRSTEGNVDDDKRGMLVLLFVESSQDAMRRRPPGQVATMACGLDAPAKGWLRVRECGCVALCNRAHVDACLSACLPGCRVL